MVMETGRFTSRRRSESVSPVGRLGIPPLVKDIFSVGSSEFISLDYSSSIHSSDYSKSSLDEESATVDDSTIDDESESSPANEDVSKPSAHRRHPAEWTIESRGTLQGSSTGSSSGSPWVDDTDSSSSESTQSPISSHYKSGSERCIFEEARSRLRSQQQRLAKRSPPMCRPPRDVSPSTLCTGRDPSKPIDVTGTPDILVAPSILEQVRQVRRGQAAKWESYHHRSDFVSSSILEHVSHARTDMVASMKTRRSDNVEPTLLEQVRQARLDKGGRVKSHRIDVAIPTARIVGLARREINTIEPTEQYNARIMVKHTIPHVVPIHPSNDDEVSTMGGTFPGFKSMFYIHRHHHQNNRGDVEQGALELNVAQKRNPEATDLKRTGSWLAHRTDLEIFLICLVVASFVTLIVLLILTIVSK